MNRCIECGTTLPNGFGVQVICADCLALKKAHDQRLANQTEKCRRCGKEFAPDALHYGKCADCTALLKNQRAELEREPAPVPPRDVQQIILTTESNSSLPITERLGIVSAEFVLGLNAFKDFGAGLRDIFGGRSTGYQDALREARKEAMDEIRREAAALGADAVVAMSLNYSEISGGKTMLLLVATGTAVKLQQDGVH